jgi:hypothetical protein
VKEVDLRRYFTPTPRPGQVNPIRPWGGGAGCGCGWVADFGRPVFRRSALPGSSGPRECHPISATPLEASRVTQSASRSWQAGTAWEGMREPPTSAALGGGRCGGLGGLGTTHTTAAGEGQGMGAGTQDGVPSWLLFRGGGPASLVQPSRDGLVHEVRGRLSPLSDGPCPGSPLTQTGPLGELYPDGGFQGRPGVARARHDLHLLQLRPPHPRPGLRPVGGRRRRALGLGRPLAGLPTAAGEVPAGSRGLAVLTAAAVSLPWRPTYCGDAAGRRPASPGSMVTAAI